MRVLFDTNVVLDVLLQRAPWVDDAHALWQAADAGRLTGYLPASSLTDIFYVARRLMDRERAKQAVQLCLEAFEIGVIDRRVLEQAQMLSGPDFEDNLIIACAELNALDAIVTRDVDDFSGSRVAVLSPAQCRHRLTPEAPNDN